MPTPLPALSDTPLFLHIAGSLVFVAAAGRGIGWALDAWVRRAPEGEKHAEPETPTGTRPQSGARIR